MTETTRNVSRTELYSSENYNIYAKIFDVSAPVFVSFMFRNRNPQPFGDSVFVKNEINAVHVLCRGPHWYQYTDTIKAGEEIRKFVKKFSRVITYGTSMGGYAALLFSGMVAADLVISCSPQFSIDPRKVGFEKRWLGDLAEIDQAGGFVCDDLEKHITRTGKVIIAYDSLDDDSRHVELIQKIRPIDHLRIPFSKHRSLTVLAEIALSSAILRQALTSDPSVAELRNEVRRRRYRSGTYLRYIGRALEQRNPQASGTLLEAAAAQTKANDYEGIESNFRLLSRLNRPRIAGEQLLLLLQSREFLERNNVIRDISRHLHFLTAPEVVERARNILIRHFAEAPASTRGSCASIILARLFDATGLREKALEQVLISTVRGCLPHFAFDLALFMDELALSDASLAMAEMSNNAYPERVDVANFLSDKLDKSGNAEAAAAVYERLDNQPKVVGDFSYRLRYARLLQRSGRFAEALTQCEQFIADVPDHDAAHRLHGQILALMMRHQEACTAFERSLAYGGGNAAVFQDLALSLKELNRSQEAAVAARRACELDPRRTVLLQIVGAF